MKKEIMKFRVALVLCLLSALLCQEAFAFGGGRGPGQRGGDGSRGGKSERYYYRGDRWYRHGWLGFDIAVSALALGALVDSLPPRRTTVIINNTPYYYCDNIYYRPYEYGGYVVVQPPAVIQPIVVNSTPMAPSQVQLPDTLTVNIPNSRGGYTTVMMRRSGNGFVGPQGEYYPEHPTVEQLKILYGK